MINAQTIEAKFFGPEYLNPSDDVVAHASRLYSAGRSEAVFDSFGGAVSGPIDNLIFFPIHLFVYFRRDNPYQRLFKPPGYGRCKLIVFKEWLVRGTYQQYDERKQQEVFMFSGIPLKHITDIQFRSSYLEVCGFHMESHMHDSVKRGEWRSGGNSRIMGGDIPFQENERDSIVELFNELKSVGRLDPRVCINF